MVVKKKRYYDEFLILYTQLWNQGGRSILEALLCA